MPTSLSPVVLAAIIYDENTEDVILDTVDSNISLNGFRYTLSLNNVAEAVLDVTYKNKAGLTELRNLFPFSNKVSYLSKCDVILLGFNTPLSNIKKDLTLFSGYVWGYGQSSKMGFTTFSLNLRGVMSRLQQIPMACPGCHIANAMDIGISPYTTSSTSADKDTNSQEAATRDMVTVLSGVAKLSKNGYALYKAIVDQYKNILSNVQGGTSGLVAEIKNRTLKDAVSAFGFEQNNNASIIDKELDNIIDPGTSINVSKSVFDNLGILLSNGMIRKFFASPELTFWDLFLECMMNFSDNLINIGPKCIISVQNPMLDPADLKVLNKVSQTDMIGYDVGDFPFFTPTRCFVAGNRYVTNQYSPTPDIFGKYPASVTEQEQATGVYSMVMETPPIFKEIDIIQTKMKEANATKAGKDVSKAEVADSIQKNETKEKTRQEYWDEYAGYLLLQEQCKQRTAIVTTRFMPEIFPGLPIHIEDPLGIAPFDGQVISVNHSIDCSQSSAVTQININYVRYQNEIKVFPNPLYPDFNISDIENLIVQEMGF